MMVGLKAYPAIKDSGVPWLGNLPAHWRMERAKWLFRKMERPVRDSDEVVTCFRDGVVTLRKDRRVRGFTESLKEIGYQGVRRGDLVIHAMDAFAGAIGVADSDGKGTPVYSVCEPAEAANAHYYAYMIREMARSQWIAALAKGIRERSTDFRFESFGSQPVPLPPLPEQAVIVRFLDHADQRMRRYIRAKQKLIQLLEEQKQAIIHRAVTRGASTEAGIKSSGVPGWPSIPMSYQRVRLGRVCLSIRDGTHNPPPAMPGVHRLLSVRNIIGSQFVIRSDDRTMTPEAFDDLQRSYDVRRGDVVIALVGATTGKTAVVQDMENVTVQRSIGILRPDPRALTGAFLNLVVRSELVQGQIRQVMNKYAAQPGIYLEEVGRLQVCFPGLEEQRAILNRVESDSGPLDIARQQVSAEIDLLKEYRTRLIADVVIGKLDVRDAAAYLPDEVREPSDDKEGSAELDDAIDNGEDDPLDGEPEVENAIQGLADHE